MTTDAAPAERPKLFDGVPRLPVWERVKLTPGVKYPVWRLVCVSCGGAIPLDTYAWRCRGTARSIHEDCEVPENEGKDEVS